MRLRALSAVGAASALACVLWVLLWPLASLSTLEAHPRGLFVAERALAPPTHARARYGAAAAQRAAAITRALIVPEAAPEASLEVPAAASDGVAAVARRLERACLQAGLSAEAPWPGAVVCAAPAAGIARGYEYVLLSTEVAVGAMGGAAAAATLLSVAALAARAPWLAKDLVLLFLVHDGADGDSVAGSEAAAAGLADFFRAHDYDGLAEARRLAAHAAWRAGAALAYLSAWQSGDWTPLAGGPVQPLLEQHGVLRAAVHMRVTAAAAAALEAHSEEPVDVGVALAAPGSRLPELDLAALMFDILAHHRLQAAVTDAEEDAVAADAPWVLADCYLAAAAGANARWATSPAGAAALHPWLRGIVSPVAAFIAADNEVTEPAAGDVAVYMQRLSAAGRMLLRLLLGPYEAHAVPLLRGVPALTLAVSAAADARRACNDGAAAANSTAMSSAPCRALTPCVGAPPLRRRAAGATAAAALGASLEHVLRSMSGTEERLHASPPGYLLLSPQAFVGLVEYALTAACLHVPLLVALLAVGWRAPRQAAVDEVIVAALLFAVGVVKLAACLIAGMPGQRGVGGLPLLLVAVDAASAGILAPLLRRWLAARAACCLPYVSPADDAAAIAALPAGGNKVHSVEQTTSESHPPQGLPPAVFFAWLALGMQQLPLLYVDFPLFFAAALVLIPALLALSAGPCAAALPAAAVTVAATERGALPPPPPPPPPAATAALVTTLCAVYCLLAPACWPMLLGAGASHGLLRRLVVLLRDHGTLHLPVLLHAQALVGHVASAAIARAAW